MSHRKYEFLFSEDYRENTYIYFPEYNEDEDGNYQYIDSENAPDMEDDIIGDFQITINYNEPYRIYLLTINSTIYDLETSDRYC